MNNTEFYAALDELGEEYLEACRKNYDDYQKSYLNVGEVLANWNKIYDSWLAATTRLYEDRNAAELKASGFHITIKDNDQNSNIIIMKKHNITSVQRHSETNHTVKLTTHTTHLSGVSVGLSVGIPAVVCILIFFIIKKFKPKMSHFRMSHGASQ